MTRSAGFYTHNPEAATCGPQKEDTTRRSRRPAGRRLPPGVYPQKSGKNLSQGPIIHRPHPHQKRRLLEFRAPSYPPGGRSSGARLPPGPERTVARSVRGRQPLKYETMGHHTVVVCLETRRSADRGPAMLQTPRGAGGGSTRGKKPFTGPWSTCWCTQDVTAWRFDPLPSR